MPPKKGSRGWNKGKKYGKGRMGMMGVGGTVTEEVKAKLEREANRQDISVSRLVGQIVEQWASLQQPIEREEDERQGKLDL